MSSRRGTIEVIARGFVMDRARRVLLCRNVKRNYFYLPGGHVEFGEPAAKALRREFREETGAPVTVGDLLLCHEQRFRDRGGPRHEINLVFHVTLRGAARVRSKEPKIDFDWLSSRELVGRDVRPLQLVPLLRRWMKGQPSDLWIEG